MGNGLPQKVKAKCISLNINETTIQNYIKLLRNHSYECQQILGQGAFGVVLKAFSKKYNKYVAIKCIQSNGSASIQRLKQEYEILKKFEGNHLFLQAYEFIEDNYQSPTLYLVTEFCEGNLKDLISQNNYQEKQRQEIQLQLLFAMCYMNQSNIVHFDIKPENVLFNRICGYYFIKVADFGIAKHLQKEQQFTEKLNTIGIGSFRYISPEVFNQAYTYTTQTDIYSLGVVFLEMEMKKLLEDSAGSHLRNGQIDYVVKNSIIGNPVIFQIIQKMIIGIEKREVPIELIKQLFSIYNTKQNKDNSLVTFNNLMDFYITTEENNIEKKGLEKSTHGIDKISNTTNLTLYLDEKNIENEGAEKLAYGLINLSNITNLSLNLIKNNIGKEGAEKLAYGLQNLSKITHLKLYLRENNIEKEGTEKLTISISKLSHLTNLVLQLDSNSIGKEGTEKLVNGLRNLQNIVTLDLDLRKNNIGNEGVQMLANSLQNYSDIINLVLEIGDNNIGKEGTEKLVNGLSNLQNIKDLTLRLWQNNIGKQGTVKLANCLQNLPNLQYLNLYLLSTNIGNEGVVKLVNCLLNLQKIRQIFLYLNYNGLDKQTLEEIEYKCENFNKIHLGTGKRILLYTKDQQSLQNI